MKPSISFPDSGRYTLGQILQDFMPEALEGLVSLAFFWGDIFIRTDSL